MEAAAVLRAILGDLGTDAQSTGASSTVIDMTHDELIAEAGRRLSEAAPKARIVLFGSHARGEAGPDSDLDFLIIEPDVENRHQESVRLRRTLRGLGVPADVIVVSAEHVEEWGEVQGTMVHEALREAASLPGRSPRDLAEVLLRRAQDDAVAVAEFAANPRIADGIIGFHAQQAAEKSLKAVIATRGLPVPRTHDLDLLAERLEDDGAQLPVARDQLGELTDYAVPLRYAELLDAEPLDREAIIGLTTEIGRWAAAEVEAHA